MLVGMWMTRDPVTVAPGTALSDAAVLMSRRRLRHLPVTHGAHLVGIVSAHDVARAYPPELNPFSAAAQDRRIARPVGHVMATPVRTVAPETPIEDAAGIFLAHRIGALPVVAHGALVGLLSEVDVLRALREMAGGDEPGVRVAFDVTERDDVLEASIALARHHRLAVQSVATLHHDARRLAVVRVAGNAVDAFVDELWRGGHRVVSVVRVPGAPVSPSSAAPASAPPRDA